MKLSVIVIGDELLIGQVADTNSGMIARKMAPYGWEVYYVQTVGDNAADISRAIESAFEQASVVITTGGLGPTKDDITKNVLCGIFGGRLVHDPMVTENINELARRRNFKMNVLTSAQAMVPSSCRVIQNKVGTAPIMWFERDNRVLVAMPGVPFETETMLAEAVMPMLLKRFPADVCIRHAVFLITGYTESALAEKIAAWEDALPPYLHLAYLPKPGLIRLRLDGIHADAGFITAKVALAADELKALLGKAVLACNDLAPAELLLNECRNKGVSLATAESCTGGNIAHELTLVSGASDVFMGGIVAYDNKVKEAVLGVGAKTLAENGAVSIPVVREMAAGALSATGASLSMSTSGIAGPGGGSDEKPVGTVCICARLNLDNSGTRFVEQFETFRFSGNRERIIDSATRSAIVMALRLLQENNY